MRSFYKFQDEVISSGCTGINVLRMYRDDLKSHECLHRICTLTTPPVLTQSLTKRSLAGYQYYSGLHNEGSMDEKGVMARFMHFEFVYSSAWPVFL